MASSSLNYSAAAKWRWARDRQQLLRIVARQVASTRVLDFGCDVPGGLRAGAVLAELCLGDLGSVQIGPPENGLGEYPLVTVSVDDPVRACMGAQYAGWKITGEEAEASYFAMGSGPMRAARGGEELLSDLEIREQSPVVVGVLESAELPPPGVCESIARQCDVAPSEVFLAVAPTASVAGGAQVVARSVETALHKLHELGFDLNRVRSGFGTAPLPPVADSDLSAIGRTNDAVLYGGRVVLWVDGDDESLEDVGPRTPSSASHDFGQPFGDVFKEAGYDFYAIDPHLFSPAMISFWNVETGNSFRYGECRPDILRKSFGG